MRRTLLLLCLLSGIAATAQQLYISSSVDTLKPRVKKALHFYRDYIYEFNKRDVLPDFSKYWSATDMQQYKQPDQILYAITSDGFTYRIAQKRTVFYVSDANGYVHIKTLFSVADTSGNVDIMSITNHYVSVDGDEIHFVNPVALYMKEHNWQSRNVRNITYYFSAYHQFNEADANEMKGQVSRLETDWGLQPINIRYYFADSRDELRRLRGLDFVTGDGNGKRASGISDDIDNIVYCAGWGEKYFHEVVHIYLNKLHPGSPLKEGLAVFYGGSMGHKLAWHLRRMSKYLDEHKDIDLNDPDAFGYMDAYTNPHSCIKGLLCRMAYDKDGIAGLRRIMEYTSMDDIYTEEFGIPKDGRDKFLRNAISKFR